MMSGVEVDCLVSSQKTGECSCGSLKGGVGKIVLGWLCLWLICLNVCGCGIQLRLDIQFEILKCINDS